MNGDRFPEALRNSARPRWSHRDPVEGGNPFVEGDPRRQAWARATERAERRLHRLDARLDAEERSGTAHGAYGDRVVDLAVARFDIWAERGLAGIVSPVGADDYARWLTTYLENWIVYVADTCPTLCVEPQLRARLDALASRWTARARDTRAST